MTGDVVTYRVYYEDTDAGGVVYYANYLKFAERARTEFLRARGVNQSQLAETDNIFWVVRHVDMELFKPARLDDVIEIETHVQEVRGVKAKMQQHLKCGDRKIAELTVTLVHVDGDFKPKRIPKATLDLFAAKGH